jgi:membrane protein YdbS with pleckstrin-like domain
VNASPDTAAILRIERPDRSLWTYYLLSLLVFPPLLPLLVLPAWFRYHSMRYKFTAEGISMSWGVLFRREVIVHYARIQDIHLRSNFVERWLGLARVLVQTASGNAGAELTLEGLKQYEAVRDFLYSRMRGVKDHPDAPAGGGVVAAEELAALTATLQEVAAEVRELRRTLAGNGVQPRETNDGV